MIFRPLILATLLASHPLMAEESVAPDVDYLTFANGALPLTAKDSQDVLKVTAEQALKLIDGNPIGFIMTPKPGDADTQVTLVYELPALTVFDRFSVPSVLETPSAFQTFFARLEIAGSTESAEGPFVELAMHDLQLHSGRNQFSEFSATTVLPVRWVKVVLSGGLDIQRDKTYFEFSELSGYGTQEAVANSERFNGKWKGRGVLMELKQEGTLVSGCYDRRGDLSGAVRGNMLYATGVDRNDSTISAFILTVDGEGRLSGLRSSNGAPFRPYPADPAPDNTDTGCADNDASILGCGSVVYGIHFAFDSAELLADADEVLDVLYRGLSDVQGAAIVIEGHTSSEGSEAYNQTLSERRAQAVVEALLQRGISSEQLSAQGLGESQPIASNDDEAGRALNRRVAVRCTPQ